MNIIILLFCTFSYANEQQVKDPLQEALMSELAFLKKEESSLQKKIRFHHGNVEKELSKKRKTVTQAEEELAKRNRELTQLEKQAEVRELQRKESESLRDLLELIYAEVGKEITKEKIENKWSQARMQQTHLQVVGGDGKIEPRSLVRFGQFALLDPKDQSSFVPVSEGRVEKIETAADAVMLVESVSEPAKLAATQDKGIYEFVRAGGPIGGLIWLLGALVFVALTVRMITVYFATQVYKAKSFTQVEVGVWELRLKRFALLIPVSAAVAPLLGLLGTVTGMIDTFESMTLHGAGKPELISGGISEALITTQLGLIVAIPALFLGQIIAAKARGVIKDMKETLQEEVPLA